MITRPLDLSARLRPAPRSLDVFFYVNVGFMALMFVLFGSRFVLSPGLGTDFALPAAGDVIAQASSTDVVIAVRRTDMALVEGAVLNFADLERWLGSRVEGRTGLRLLIQADAAVSAQDIAQLHRMAADAGFAGVIIAAEPASAEAGP
ncbi:MAG: biopolymer transporter ExbD [Verrucomicrobiota bacterium]